MKHMLAASEASWNMSLLHEGEEGMKSENIDAISPQYFYTTYIGILWSCIWGELR